MRRDGVKTGTRNVRGPTPLVQVRRSVTLTFAAAFFALGLAAAFFAFTALGLAGCTRRKGGRAREGCALRLGRGNGAARVARAHPIPVARTAFAFLGAAFCTLKMDKRGKGGRGRRRDERAAPREGPVTLPRKLPSVPNPPPNPAAPRRPTNAQ